MFRGMSAQLKVPFETQRGAVLLELALSSMLLVLLFTLTATGIQMLETKRALGEALEEAMYTGIRFPNFPDDQKDKDYTDLPLNSSATFHVWFQKITTDVLSLYMQKTPSGRKLAIKDISVTTRLIKDTTIGDYLKIRVSGKFTGIFPFFKDQKVDVELYGYCL